MNLVVNQAHEYPKNCQPAAAASGKVADNKRDIGLVIIRGEHVVNITAVKKKKTVDAKVAGSGGAGSSAVPGAAVSKTSQPNLPKASGARRQRNEDE